MLSLGAAPRSRSKSAVSTCSAGWGGSGWASGVGGTPDPFYEILGALAGEHEEQVRRLKSDNDKLSRRVQTLEEAAAAGPCVDPSSAQLVPWTGDKPGAPYGVWCMAFACGLRGSWGQRQRGGMAAAAAAQEAKPVAALCVAVSEETRPPATPDTGVRAKERNSERFSQRFTDLMKMPGVEHIGDEEEEDEVEQTKNCYDKLRDLIKTSYFELFVGLLVTANACFSAAEMQLNGITVGKDLGFNDFDKSVMASWEHSKRVFQFADYCFTSVFCVELILRVIALRGEFFHTSNALNWLDVVAVVSGVLNFFMEDDGAGKASVIRLLRLVKLSRGLRLIRMARVLESLHFLLQSMRASLSTLFWSLCVLLIIQCISGMVLSSLVSDFISDEEKPLHGRRDVYKYYGTFTRAMITMFEIHLANWAPACRVLVDNVDEWIGYVFLAYRCLAGFAVLNVINAVFIQQTMRVAAQDQQLMILEKQKLQEQNKRHIMAIFSELDKSGDGVLSRDEFDVLLTDSRLRTWLSCLDIDMTDVTHLISLLDDGDGEINSTEFMKRLASLKGPAKSIDMAELLARTARIEAKLKEQQRAAAEAASRGFVGLERRATLASQSGRGGLEKRPTIATALGASANGPGAAQQ